MPKVWGGHVRCTRSGFSAGSAAPFTVHLTSRTQPKNIIAAMQSQASRRAFGFLASKIHPQLPLSPRESAQLLALLTSSFRAHLDKAHPPADASPARARRPSLAHSSQSSASQHIESILTNPLFAVRPHARSFDAARADAQAVLRDPLSWFLDQAAIGAADLTTAATCITMLKENQADVDTAISSRAAEASSAASEIAKWLRSSGMENSREFISFNPARLLNPLATMLSREGEHATLWTWIARSIPKRTQETGLDEAKIRTFRQRVLRSMVAAKVTGKTHIDEALSAFLRACKLRSLPGFDLDARTLQPAGFWLVDRIVSDSHSVESPELYESFVKSSKDWTSWSPAVESVLWLHHPTKPSALSGAAYIRDPSITTARASPNMRKLLVHLCLGIARQSLVEKSYADAEVALKFASDAFPELVGAASNVPDVDQKTARQKSIEHERREEENLELLDRLIPT